MFLFCKQFLYIFHNTGGFLLRCCFHFITKFSPIFCTRNEDVFNMSHDIRTPMNAIIGFTALAAAHVNQPDQVQEYLNKISTSGQHLLSLINDVLDMSRIESGRVKIEEKEVHLPM